MKPLLVVPAPRVTFLNAFRFFRRGGKGIIFAVKIFTFLTIVPSLHAQSDLSLETLQTNLDYGWILIASALVFLMQSGFMCIEAGISAAKHSINVSIKNMADFIIAVMAFWALGFGLMFGVSQGGWIGSSNFFLSANDPWTTLLFVFQAVFVSTAATINSGAIAGRTKFKTYLMISLIISVVIYPVFGHWVWGSLFHPDQQGWLEQLGFIDFAGATVVHSVGGWVALAGVIIIGPRLGKFSKDGTPNRFQPHNLTLAYLGAFILFFGWFGFNGGSTLALNAEVAPIIFNTILSGCFGGFSCSLLSWIFDVFKRPQEEMIINGVLGGLVAVTASCHGIESMGAALIGLVGGVVVFVGIHFIERVLKLDDVVGAIAVHGFAGVWGTLAVAIFILPEKLEASSRMAQMAVQLVGVVAGFAWAFGVGYLLLSLLNWISPLRVSPEDETVGLNVSEHGATSTLLEIAQAMHQAT